MVQVPTHIDPAYENLFRQYCQDIDQMGLANAVGGWCASSLTSSLYEVAREAVMARKITDIQDVGLLSRLVPKGHGATEVLRHAIEAAARGTPHALGWVRALTQVAPWATESLAGEARWLELTKSLPGAEKRMRSRSWRFLWKAMSTRWIDGPLVARRNGLDVGEELDVLGLALVADLAGDGFTWDRHAAPKLEARLGQGDWVGHERQVFVDRLLARVRRQLLQGQTGRQASLERARRSHKL